MSQKQHCLNCNEIISKHFCPNCGQKTDTHRITFKHFITHDIVHGIWHFERGILYTLKEAIVRPGKAALDYISGKRVRYYNVFYLTLLLIGLNVLLLHFYDTFKEVAIVNDSKKDTSPNITKFFSENIKLILLCIVPILGSSSYIVFRRLKLNIAEHFIVGGMCLLGMIQFVIVFSFLDFMTEKTSSFVVGFVEATVFFLILLFPIWCYSSIIKSKYTFLGCFWRLIAFYFLIFLFIQLIMAVIILTITNGNSSFYISL